jgi:hypothetical protein
MRCRNSAQGKASTLSTSCRNSTSSNVFALTLRTASVCSDCAKVIAHVVHAAARGADDIVEFLKISNKQGFSRCGFRVAATVGHRLPTAGLVERILDLNAKAPQKLQCCDSDLRMEGVNVTEDEKTNSNVALLFGTRSMVLSTRADFALENGIDHDCVDQYQRQHHDARSPEDEGQAACGRGGFVDRERKRHDVW